MINRRTMIATAGSAALLSACRGNGVGTEAGLKLDARIEATENFLFKNFPDTQELAREASGILIMPLVTEVGLIYGGGYGKGALRIEGATVDYYSATRATFGLQIGAQQYAHALFFMTEGSLQGFRRASGWTAGADLNYAALNNGGNLGKDVIERGSIIAFVFGQQGLILGATLNGAKYSRIIP